MDKGEMIGFIGIIFFMALVFNSLVFFSSEESNTFPIFMTIICTGIVIFIVAETILFFNHKLETFSEFLRCNMLFLIGSALFSYLMIPLVLQTIKYFATLLEFLAWLIIGIVIIIIIIILKYGIYHLNRQYHGRKKEMRKKK